MFLPESSISIVFERWRRPTSSVAGGGVQIGEPLAVVRSERDHFVESHESGLDIWWFLRCEQPGTIAEMCAGIIRLSSGAA